MVIVALPIAMLIAFILMQQFGLSANLMSLAGLAIGIGMMVDGAVVMVENGFRLLAHARRRSRSQHVILEAAREVANPIAFAILIIIVVFLPLFSLEGLEGKLFKPMAYAISFAMAGSLLLTLTLVPVLAALALRAKTERETFIVRWIKCAYLPLLDRALVHQRHSDRGGARAACRLARALPVPRQGVHAEAAGGRNHVPRHRDPVDLARGVGACLPRMNVVLKKRFPQTTSVLATIGRAEKGETTDANYMEVLVAVKPESEWPEHDHARAVGAMQEKLGGSHPHGGFRRDAADPDAGRGADLGRARDARAQGLRRIDA